MGYFNRFGLPDETCKMVTGDEINALEFTSPICAYHADSYFLNKTAGKINAQTLPIQSAQI